MSPLSSLSYWVALATGEMRLYEPCGNEGRQEKGNCWGYRERSGSRESCLIRGPSLLSYCSALARNLAQLSLFCRALGSFCLNFKPLRVVFSCVIKCEFSQGGELETFIDCSSLVAGIPVIQHGSRQW